MKLSIPDILFLAVSFAAFGTGSAKACNPGDIQCDNAGYRYVCQCWTSEGCQYYPNGSCSAYHSGPQKLHLRKIDYSPRKNGDSIKFDPALSQ